MSSPSNVSRSETYSTPQSVDGAASLVVAVVPLGEVGFDLRPIAEAGEIARRAGARAGACQHTRELDPVDPGLER
jgi:hypothetical protein